MATMRIIPGSTMIPNRGKPMPAASPTSSSDDASPFGQVLQKVVQSSQGAGTAQLEQDDNDGDDDGDDG
jgi:hypothetical protein